MVPQKNYFLLPLVQNMNKEFLIFGNIEIDKCKFHYPKNPIWIDDVDIDRILISSKVSFDKDGLDNFLVTKMMIIKLGHRVW